MLPLMAVSISASVGFGFFASRATADIIWPDWQYPHCGTSSSIQAFCTAWLPSAERPSMVVTFFPDTLEIGVIHERSEEHTSELQSHVNIVCRLLLEKQQTIAPSRDMINRLLFIPHTYPISMRQ